MRDNGNMCEKCHALVHDRTNKEARIAVKYFGLSNVVMGIKATTVFWLAYY